MTDKVVIKEKTVNKAVAEALLQLGARKNEVKITVLEEPKEGLFGFIGRRSAKVEVVKKQRRGKKPNRNNKAQRNHRPNTEKKQEAKRKSPKKKPTNADKPSRKKVSVTPIGDPVQATTIVSPIGKTDISDAAETQKLVAEKLMVISGFPCRCDIDTGEYNSIKITTDADSAGILIGRRGYTVDAIEHLVDRMSARSIGEHVRMNLDVNNYRKKRNIELTEQTKEAASSVIETGKKAHMSPVCARERRLMHMTVAEFDGLDTYTAGYGPERHVVICLEKRHNKAE